MKRLVAGGMDKIFQITKCFRSGEKGKNHNVEFTMLEWYRKDADYFNLIDDAKKLLNYVCDKTKTDRIFSNWKILSLDDLWKDFTGKKLEDIPDAFDFDKTMVDKIEPGLNENHPIIITDFPAIFSPMCKTKNDDPYRAERLEIYFKNIELGNGCTEQIDKKIQIKRLLNEQIERRNMGKDVYPWPAEFVDSLDHMPPTAGMAIGIDRLVMILCDKEKIEDVITFTETINAAFIKPYGRCFCKITRWTTYFTNPKSQTMRLDKDFIIENKIVGIAFKRD